MMRLVIGLLVLLTGQVDGEQEATLQPQQLEEEEELHSLLSDLLDECGSVDSCTNRLSSFSSAPQLQLPRWNQQLLAGRHWDSTMPPLGTGHDAQATAAWFEAHAPAQPPPPPKGRTPREAQLLRWSAHEFVAARAAGTVSCEEYARVLLRQAIHYKDHKAFCHWRTHGGGGRKHGLEEPGEEEEKDFFRGWTAEVLRRARELDDVAAAVGSTSALAPLYCLPVPAKDTLATRAFPSAAGSLHFDGRRAVRNAAVVERIEQMHGIIMGKTNTPPFAYSWTTCSAGCGCAVNAYGPQLHTCGSSGGSGVAVSLHAAPIALTEDTGGSTRCPAASNGNFGYDPYQNKFNYPSDGNIGITYVNDQLGINTRSMEDVLWWDRLTGDLTQEHLTASRSVDRMQMKEIRIGLPIEYLVEHCVHNNGDTTFGGPLCTDKIQRPAQRVMERYNLVKSALEAIGVTLVLQDWPKRSAADDMNYLEWAYNHAPRATNQSQSPPAEAFYNMPLELVHYANTYLGMASDWNSLVNDDLLVQLAGGVNGARHPFAWFHDLLSLEGFRHANQVWVPRVAIPAWNSYFDKYDLDMILLPGGLCGSYTYAEMADGRTRLGVSYDGGATWTEEAATQLECNFISYFIAKQFPVSKIMFPVGGDERTNGTLGMQFLSRSGPPGADPNVIPIMGKRKENTWDLPFLHKVKRVLKALYQQSPELKRFDPPHLGL